MSKIVSNISYVWLQSRLDVDIKNEGPSKAACTDIIKKGVRQQRYHLKTKYFDPTLTMEQLLAKQPPPKMKKEEWVKLVEYWCDPKNKVHAWIISFCYYAMQPVHVNDNSLLHLWCRKNLLRIKLTEAKCSCTKRLELGHILPIDTAWYRYYVFCIISLKDGTFVA